MPAAPLPDTLQRLRRSLENIQGLGELSQHNQSVRLGIPDLDQALGGGLLRGGLHDLIPAAPLQLGAAMGFALALAIRARAGMPRKPLFWLQTDFARHEAGAPYGPGFACFGLPMQQLVMLRTVRAIDALWAAEEAMRCGAAGAVITELCGDDADLTATRRLALAARDGSTIGFLLRHRSVPALSAATTRWEIAGAASVPDAYGGLGATAFSLNLLKNRRGASGRWIIRWDHYAHSFAPASFPLDMDAPARDRQDRAPAFGRAS